jgi:antitoxin (DNA-binding transcriptional repressor) of toxin-antitoxin stability system
MKIVSLLEFRKNAQKIIRFAQQGQRMIMTYRGKPVCRLEPILYDDINENDPFYNIDRLAEKKGKNLSNREIDGILYGK